MANEEEPPPGGASSHEPAQILGNDAPLPPSALTAPGGLSVSQSAARTETQQPMTNEGGRDLYPDNLTGRLFEVKLIFKYINTYFIFEIFFI